MIDTVTETPEEILARFHKWTHFVAGKLTGGSMHPLYDDLVQEAKIEMLRVLEAKGHDVAATYLTQAARSRMLAALTREVFTGGDTKPGPKSRPARELVDWAEADWQEGLGTLLSAPDLLDGAALAYHRGELREALSALSEADRDYVVRKFWGGSTDREIEEDRGERRGASYQRWNRRIRPMLAERLEHLSAV